MNKIDEILLAATERGASDVHILARLAPHARVNGRLFPLNMPPMTSEDIEALIREILTLQQYRAFEETKELDFSYGIEGVSRFRINLHYQRNSVGIAIRPLKDRIPTFQELGLPEQVILKLLAQPYGLILLCGPTGSGKSTTLASMVEHLNQHEPIHIVTLEDPIEYLFRHKKAIVEQREIGSDTESFNEALRRALRQDPDVVLIGEMRDRETIEAALRIAETGHLVMATLHTGEVSQAMGRIVNTFPNDQQQIIQMQLSLILLGVIAQQLLPKEDGSGRVLATECLVSTPAVKNLVREGQFSQLYNQIQLGGGVGMHTFNSALVDLLRRGFISRETAFDASLNHKELIALLSGK